MKRTYYVTSRMASPLVPFGVRERFGEPLESGVPVQMRGTAEKGGREGANPAVHIETVGDPAELPRLIEDWQRLLAASQSPEKIYQSPSFYRYLLESADPVREPFRLLVVRQRENGPVIGIIPARLGRHALRVGIGSSNCWTWHFPVVQLLGSVPLIEQGAGVFEAVLGRLLDEFPMAMAVSLQALPVELYGQLQALEGLASCVPDGWRECHTLPLPENFASYLQKLTAKKRYNLARQVRLLARAAGPLQVHPVERPDQVPLLNTALSALMLPDDFAAFARPGRFERLAAHGLLLSYVVVGGGATVGVIVGTSSVDKWLVHNILSCKQFADLSPGTSTLHLALEDVMRGRGFVQVDFGYGSPNRDFRTTHVLQQRGHALIYRRSGRLPVLLACYRLYSWLYNFARSGAKRLRRQCESWRTWYRQRAGGWKPK